MVPYGYHRKMKRQMGNVEWPDGGKKHTTCGKCGEKYEKRHENCPKCGKENDGHHGKCGKDHDGKHRKCGKCGEEYEKHHEKCPNCGKKYGGKLCWFRVHPKLPNNA
jgi:predicted amidophosphoribosyltransferase